MVASTPALFRYFTLCAAPTASSPISKDNKGASYQDGEIAFADFLIIDLCGKLS